MIRERFGKRIWKQALLGGVAGALVVAGACSASVYGLQDIRLKVVDAESQEPVPNVRIFAFETFDSGECPGADEFRNSIGDGTGKTDAEGLTTIRISTSTPCPGAVLACQVDTCRSQDQITGRDYCFALEFGDTGETVAVTMSAGEQTTGDFFELIVELISEPLLNAD